MSEYHNQRGKSMKQAPLEAVMADMEVGEVVALDDKEILKVPAGWIFYRTHKAGITGTFVPDLAGLSATGKAKQSNIVMPH